MTISRALLTAGLVASFVLAGCELPRPFAHRGPVVQNDLLTMKSGEGVRVVVLDGLEPEIAGTVRDAAIRGLTEAGIPASGDTALSAGYVLTGAVQISDPDGGAPEQARFIWQLTRKDGTALGAFDSHVAGRRAGWLGRDPAALDPVAQDIGVQVAGLLHDRGARTATVDGVTEAAVPALKVRVYFEGVIGAPGDGNESLARAMVSVLKRTTIPLAESADAATHLLAATVAAQPRSGGVSDVAIDWILSARDGTEIGTVSQRNPVKTAQIELRWGDLAFLVAEAASGGIEDAFATIGQPKKQGLALPKPR